MNTEPRTEIKINCHFQVKFRLTQLTNRDSSHKTVCTDMTTVFQFTFRYLHQKHLKKFSFKVDF